MLILRATMVANSGSIVFLKNKVQMESQFQVIRAREQTDPTVVKVKA
jgi:hypothetical protein